jgi:hypothetical protein
MPKLQTLVFTATLSNSLRFDVKKRKGGKKSKGKTSEGTMGKIYVIFENMAATVILNIWTIF